MSLAGQEDAEEVVILVSVCVSTSAAKLVLSPCSDRAKAAAATLASVSASTLV